MMTRDEILEIDQYSQEHQISFKQHLDEFRIPSWNFYKAKRKCRHEDGAYNSPGKFVWLAPGSFNSGMMPVRNGMKATPTKGEQIRNAS